LRLITSAHTNYLFTNFKKLPYKPKGRAVYIKITYKKVILGINLI